MTPTKIKLIQARSGHIGVQPLPCFFVIIETQTETVFLQCTFCWYPKSPEKESFLLTENVGFELFEEENENHKGQIRLHLKPKNNIELCESLKIKVYNSQLKSEELEAAILAFLAPLKEMHQS